MSLYVPPPRFFLNFPPTVYRVLTTLNFLRQRLALLLFPEAESFRWVASIPVAKSNPAIELVSFFRELRLSSPPPFFDLRLPAPCLQRFPAYFSPFFPVLRVQPRFSRCALYAQFVFYFLHQMMGAFRSFLLFPQAFSFCFSFHFVHHGAQSVRRPLPVFSAISS